MKQVTHLFTHAPFITFPDGKLDEYGAWLAGEAKQCRGIQLKTKAPA